MTKKLDALHYILILGLIGVLGLFLYSRSRTSYLKNTGKDNYAFLIAKFKADSLFLSQNYDEALNEYKRLDSIYPYRLNLPAMQVLINEMKSNESSITIDHTEHSSRIEQEKSHLKKSETSHTPPEVNDNEKSPENSNFAKTSNDKNLQQVDEIVKGVLHLINYDGAEIDYIGEVKNGKASGFGFAIFEHKGFYEGEWDENMRNGKGLYSLAKWRHL